MRKKYTVKSCAEAERDFIGETDLPAVTLLMSGADSLYHDTLKGIGQHIKDKKFYEKADAWADIFYSLGKGRSNDPKNAKVRALRRLSSWFNFLADAFEYVETRKDVIHG